MKTAEWTQIQIGGGWMAVFETARDARKHRRNRYYADPTAIVQ